MNEESTKRAVALSYRSDQDQAPRLLAKGERLTAERMIELAKEAGITIVENASLTNALAQLDMGDLIPTDLYQAVAEILAFVYRVDDRYGKRHVETLKGGA